MNEFSLTVFSLWFLNTCVWRPPMDWPQPSLVSEPWWPPPVHKTRDSSTPALSLSPDLLQKQQKLSSPVTAARSSRNWLLDSSALQAPIAAWRAAFISCSKAFFSSVACYTSKHTKTCHGPFLPDLSLANSSNTRPADPSNKGTTKEFNSATSGRTTSDSHSRPATSRAQLLNSTPASLDLRSTLSMDLVALTGPSLA